MVSGFAIGWWFDALDRMRRRQGKALDAVDLGPHESAYRIVHSRPGARLRHYGAESSGNPSLLIVPAPIKRPYIWDLFPEKSVVRRAMDRGLDVFLVEWTEPDQDGVRLGLEECAGFILDECLDAIHAHRQPDRIFLAGHSLGGTLAAIYAAYRPERVAGLVLIEAPVHFGDAAGVFTTLLGSGVPAKAVVPPSGRVPGSLVNLISTSAAPATFYFERYIDWVASFGSGKDLLAHWRVERWTLDEFPLPQQLFEDLVEKLYREDQFMRGELTIGTVRLQPSKITAPLFSVYEPSSSIIPRDSVIRFHQAAGSRNKVLLAYTGDVGVALQHVGALVGNRAHGHVWPEIFAWLDRISSS